MLNWAELVKKVEIASDFNIMPFDVVSAHQHPIHFDVHASTSIPHTRHLWSMNFDRKKLINIVVKQCRSSNSYLLNNGAFQ